MKLPLLPCDKANHFVYGFVIYESTRIMLPLITLSLGWFGIEMTLRWLPFLAAVCGAVGREVHDKLVKNRWEKLDILATLAPAIVLELEMMCRV